MLIQGAELDGRVVDLRLATGRVTEIAPHLSPIGDEAVLAANGGALLPGLHDHHFHISALAAALASVRCGPPQVNDEAALGAALQAAAAAGTGWLRGIAYHDGVAGAIDRHWLDRWVPARPLRVQHRSGRLWILNSCAVGALKAGADSPLEYVDGEPTGRLYDADDWLRGQLGSQPPDLAAASRLLASFGVTGVTDVTHHNTLTDYHRFAAARQRGELLQDLLVMGDASLDGAPPLPGLRPGALKLHLHDADLPDFDQTCAAIRHSHRHQRPVAVHCVARGELVFTLAALEAAGSLAGDRIEHAGVTPPELLPTLRALGLTVVTQPNFIGERGDAYLAEVAAEDLPWLYRARGLLAAGIPIAGGTDAPFGEPDPWRAMQAAVDRRTPAGTVLGADETLSPEQALALFTGDPLAPGGPPRRIAPDASADLCLLDRPWAAARTRLDAVQVIATLRGGELIWQC